MRTTAGEVEKARKALADKLERVVVMGSDRRELSKLIAKFTAANVRDDRVHRKPYDALAKFADVFFNHRPA